ncbi:hypothetical protein TKK_0010793 [Trichogramma kaykai]
MRQILRKSAIGECPEVKAPQWGSVRERVRANGSLETIYSCEPGRKIKGHKVLTCTENGWNRPVPTCVPIGNNFQSQYLIDYYYYHVLASRRGVCSLHRKICMLEREGYIGA